MARPRNSVTTFAISFSEALVRRATTPHSRMKLPSMMVPRSGRPFGAIRPPTSVTTSGNRSRARAETLFLMVGMRTVRSFCVVSARMMGGWMIGTSAM